MNIVQLSITSLHLPKFHDKGCIAKRTRKITASPKKIEWLNTCFSPQEYNVKRLVLKDEKKPNLKQVFSHQAVVYPN